VEEMSIGEFARRSRLSPKALRLYDGLGLLSPARVDELSGYRYYEDAQLSQARLIAALRQVGVPLTTVHELLALDPAELAKHVTEFWREAEQRHARQRDGAAFCIHWGQVSADSDGPLEWCRPIPDDQAEELAAQFPELTLRVEPAHREAYVDLGPSGRNGVDPAHWQLVDEALRSWADSQGLDPKQLSLTPEDLGVRITYLATPPITETSLPDCDFAVPFA